MTSRTLATKRIKGRTPLHIYADAPGHRPNPKEVVQAHESIKQWLSQQ